jgi:UDP-N-acetylmuramate--alanine ligase
MEHPDARYIGSMDEAAGFLADHVHPGDLLITLGAGDGYQVGEMVIKELSSQEYQA